MISFRRMVIEVLIEVGLITNEQIDSISLPEDTKRSIRTDPNVYSFPVPALEEESKPIN